MHTIDATPLLDAVIRGLARHRLSPGELRTAVDCLWGLGRVVSASPASHRYAQDVLGRLDECAGTNYGAGCAARFRSHRLFGGPGGTGAIHVDAPPELRDSTRWADKNRPPHFHATARLSVITRGRARFAAHRHVGGRDLLLVLPVTAGDVVVCPAGVVHTFDAGHEGFALVSAMEGYLDPGGPDYALDPVRRGIDLDALPTAGAGWLGAAGAHPERVPFTV